MPNAFVSWLTEQAGRWTVLKHLIESTSGISQDAMHVLGGVLAQLACAWALRSSVARWLPWLVVLGLELANEANDLRMERWPDLSVQIAEGIKDTGLTMLLPTVLLVLARRRSRLFSNGVANDRDADGERSAPSIE